MQAAALGTYLLYTPQGQYLTDAGSGSLAAQADPSPAAEWVVTGNARRGFTLTDLATKTPIPVGFHAAGGCAVYPEAQVNATGNSFAGASPEANALGTVEGHAHITAFELFGGDWHCGTPVEPVRGGRTRCRRAARTTSRAPTARSSRRSTSAASARPSDFHGWPTFVGWPSPTALAEEGDYYTGVERAWRAGLRIFVTDLVDNEQLCQEMTVTHLPCNDMTSVHVQSKDLYALQNYIDAQSGGPGKGWFRIVTDPFQARRVINQGKLAVIEGIEVSRIFGCGEQNNVPAMRAGAGRRRAQGGPRARRANLLPGPRVRQRVRRHEDDRRGGGRGGERRQPGGDRQLLDDRAVSRGQDQDAEQTSVPGGGLPASLLNGPVASLTGGNPLPVYGPGPQCNVHGLTDLGAYLINRMIQQHFIIQTDHMSSKTAAAATAIATAHHYSGIVSAHCCSSPQLFQQIYADGGFVSEPVAPVGRVRQHRAGRSRPRANPAYHFGFGWGSDMNGLGTQPGPSSHVSGDLPVQVLRRQRDLRPRGVGSADLRPQHGRPRQLWPVRRLAAQRPARGRQRDDAGHVPGRGVLPPDVGACRRRAVDELFAAADPLRRCSRFGNRLRLGETTTQALFSSGQPVARPGPELPLLRRRFTVASCQRRLQPPRPPRADRRQRGRAVGFITSPRRPSAAAPPRLRADLRAAGV